MKKIDFNCLSEKEQELIRKTMEARENSYAPISKFKVGAGLLTQKGEIYTGVNVEISSFTPTICAERNAVFSYFSTGGREFDAMAIFGSQKNTFPCGVCRQVIYELSPNCTIYIVNSQEDILQGNIRDLLPHGFRWEEE